MADARITAPDGTKLSIKGISDDPVKRKAQIEGALTEYRNRPITPQDDPEHAKSVAAASSIVDWVPGHGDKIAEYTVDPMYAGIGKVANAFGYNLPDTWEEATAFRKAAIEQHPIINFTSSLPAGFGVGKGLTKLGTKVAPEATQAVSNVFNRGNAFTRMGKAGATGGLIGAYDNVLRTAHDEGYDRFEDAVEDAGSGFVLGGVMGSAFRGVGDAIQGGRNMWRKFSADPMKNEVSSTPNRQLGDVTVPPSQYQKAADVTMQTNRLAKNAEDNKFIFQPFYNKIDAEWDISPDGIGTPLFLRDDLPPSMYQSIHNIIENGSDEAVGTINKALIKARREIEANPLYAAVNKNRSKYEASAPDIDSIKKEYNNAVTKLQESTDNFYRQAIDRGYVREVGPEDPRIRKSKQPGMGKGFVYQGIVYTVDDAAPSWFKSGMKVAKGALNLGTGIFSEDPGRALGGFDTMYSSITDAVNKANKDGARNHAGFNALAANLKQAQDAVNRFKEIDPKGDFTKAYNLFNRLKTIEAFEKKIAGSPVKSTAPSREGEEGQAFRTPRARYLNKAEGVRWAYEAGRNYARKPAVAQTDREMEDLAKVLTTDDMNSQLLYINDLTRPRKAQTPYAFSPGAAEVGLGTAFITGVQP